MEHIYVHSSFNDRTTIHVLEWIYYFGGTVVRVNDILPMPPSGIEIQPFDETGPAGPRMNYWYRRGTIQVVNACNNYFDDQFFIRHMERDWSSIAAFYNSILSEHEGINCPLNNQINKLEVLSVAKKLKIPFPKTWVGTNVHCCPFVRIDGRCIAKSLNSPNLIVKFKGITFQLHSGNVLIEEDDINTGKVPSIFMPSLFQEYIDKKYELRIFYLKGEFYTMAIFSQQSEKTKIDFRNYDNEKPNRCVPYELPKFVKIKLNKLMRKLNLNCGSIDMIVSPTGKYYFLEVNPIGQFQWLSSLCNYYLERKIAKYLCKF